MKNYISIFYLIQQIISNIIMALFKEAKITYNLEGLFIDRKT